MPVPWCSREIFFQQKRKWVSVWSRLGSPWSLHSPPPVPLTCFQHSLPSSTSSYPAGASRRHLSGHYWGTSDSWDRKPDAKQEGDRHLSDRRSFTQHRPGAKAQNSETDCGAQRHSLVIVIFKGAVRLPSCRRGRGAGHPTLLPCT